MAESTISTVHPITGETIVFAIETDPNWVSDKEYQDDDGNWWPIETKEQDEEEEKK